MVSFILQNAIKMPYSSKLPDIQYLPLLTVYNIGSFILNCQSIKFNSQSKFPATHYRVSLNNSKHSINPSLTLQRNF